MKTFNIKIKDKLTHTTSYETNTTIEKGVMVLPYKELHTNCISYQYLIVSEFTWFRNNKTLLGFHKIYKDKYIVVTEM